MMDIYRKVCAASFAVMTISALVSSPLSADPEYYDGNFGDGDFARGYELGAAFATGEGAEPAGPIGQSLASLTPGRRAESGAGESQAITIVPWTDAAALGNTQADRKRAKSSGPAWGLAGLIEAARESYLRQGGTVDGDGVMRLDQTLGQVLTDLKWRKRAVSELSRSE